MFPRVFPALTYSHAHLATSSLLHFLHRSLLHLRKDKMLTFQAVSKEMQYRKTVRVGCGGYVDKQQGDCDLSIQCSLGANRTEPGFNTRNIKKHIQQESGRAEKIHEQTSQESLTNTSEMNLPNLEIDIQNASRYPIISKSCSIKGPSWQNPIRPRLALAIAACLHINLCHSLLWTCPNLIFLRLPQVGVGVEPISEDRSQPLPKSIS